jgi:N-acetylmuramoyl-L-alanine amidase
MPIAKSTTAIVIHCSAGFGDVESIKKFWKSKGWTNVGYHMLVDLNGVIHVLSNFDNITNGVLGHNSSIINICYIGGVEVVNKALKAKDTRTEKQKNSLIHCINTALKWLHEKGCDMDKLEIKGHRDFSPDKNGSGVIESWERIKECPCFDAIPEYEYLLKTYKIKAENTHTVVAGDTLFGIAKKYNMTINEIRTLNWINGEVLKVGQILIIK